MEKNNFYWTAEEIGKVITTTNNYISKRKAFDKLSNDLGRTSDAVQNIYYKFRHTFNTDITNEQRELAVWRLAQRGLASVDIARSHGITREAVDQIVIKKRDNGEEPRMKKQPSTKKQTKLPLFTSTTHIPTPAPKAEVKPQPKVQTKTPTKPTTKKASFEFNFLWGLLKVTRNK